MNYGLGRTVGLGLTVEGADQLATNLQMLGAAVRRRALLKVLRAAAVPIQGRAAELARIDPRTPRHLKDWIVISPQPAGTSDAEASVAVGPATSVFWGLFLEFGTVKMSPKPFMRPAFDYGTDRALSILRDGLWALLEDASTGRGVFDFGDAT